MIIIGVDFHPEFQEIASVDTDTGEYQEKHLAHPEEAEQFYRALASVGQMVRVGMEASGHGSLRPTLGAPLIHFVSRFSHFSISDFGFHAEKGTAGSCDRRNEPQDVPKSCCGFWS